MISARRKSRQLAMNRTSVAKNSRNPVKVGDKNSIAGWTQSNFPMPRFAAREKIQSCRNQSAQLRKLERERTSSRNVVDRSCPSSAVVSNSPTGFPQAAHEGSIPFARSSLKSLNKADASTISWDAI
jgi:hypothetical protein